MDDSGKKDGVVKIVFKENHFCNREYELQKVVRWGNGETNERFYV